jgi:cob(I)alamin adenosyltransferase
MHICGSLDEVSSFLGMAKSCAADGKTKATIESAQKTLIRLNAEVASAPAAVARLKNRIARDSITLIEKQIECIEGKCSVRTRSFCLQGANVVSSSLDVARAITRRAERMCVTMTKKKLLANPDILVYLNRLSDLLYLLARQNESI